MSLAKAKSGLSLPDPVCAHRAWYPMRAVRPDRAGPDLPQEDCQPSQRQRSHRAPPTPSINLRLILISTITAASKTPPSPM
ncbi:hypothetical protein SAMN05519105_0664 [Rhodobacter sp. 24-YEA-8]|nr:hypothetical protein SAMN05519105_0664 [Rhodobacter sp. 24-YEA-8]